MMLSIFSCAYWPSVCLLWRNVYLGLLSIFLLDFFSLLSCVSYLNILEINTFSVTLFANIFSQCIACLFVLFMVSFAVQRLISLIRSHLCFFFAFISIALVDWPKKTLVWFMSENVSPVFSSRSFTSLLFHVGDNESQGHSPGLSKITQPRYLLSPVKNKTAGSKWSHLWEGLCHQTET